MKDVKVFAKELSDAYSSAAYKAGWGSCIKMLRKRGYNDAQVEAIIRSKFTRWARDMHSSYHGNAPMLARWLDRNPSEVLSLFKECGV